MKATKVRAAVVLLLLAIAPAAYSQMMSGQITGRLADSAGALVVGAKVQLTNELTSQMREFLTDSRDRLLGRLKEMKDPEQAIELAVRAALNRAPAAEEKKAMMDYLATRRDRLPEGLNRCFPEYGDHGLTHLEFLSW